MGAWAVTLEPKPLLERARSLVPDALSCGYTGLVMLHGMLASGMAGEWRPMSHNPFALAHPTYYGMMVSGFERQSE